MTILTTIFSYKGGKEITERHSPLWRMYSDKLLIISPTNSPCIILNADNILYEESNKFGIPMIKRQLFGMKKALEYNYDYYVFIEYDGFMLSRPKEREAIQTNTNYDTEGNKFISKYFHHFPWVFPKEMLVKFCINASLEPYENGFVDRWLASQIDILNLPFFDLQKAKEGFSRNTINQVSKENLYCSISNGTYAIHGIKDSGILSETLKLRENYINNEK